MQKIPGCMQRIVKQNQEELFISIGANASGKARSRSSFTQVAQEGESISKLYSYPSSVTGISLSHQPTTTFPEPSVFFRIKTKIPGIV